MKRFLIAISIAGALLVFAAGVAAQVGAEVALRAAIEKETVKGDLKGAIDQYKKLAQDKDRAVAAKALVRMGECYEKLGDAGARKAYERVEREFGDQKDAAATASARLSALGKPATGSGPATRLVASYTGNEIPWLLGTSPDGRYLLLRDEGAGFSLRNMNTGVNRRLFQSQTVSAAFSQDGRGIAFVRYVDATPDAWGIAADGTGQRMLWHGEKGWWATLMGWFPDHKRFLIQVRPDEHSSRLIAVSAIDGSSEKLWEGPLPGSGQLSPDGTQVVFINRVSQNPERDELRLLSVANSTQGVLLEASGMVGVPLQWTPDGSGIVFLSDRLTSGVRQDLWHLFVANGKAQGRPELIKADFASFPRLSAITRDGTLYYQQSVDMREILTTEIDPVAGKPVGGLVAVSQEAGQPAYSPDGERLAYRRSYPTSTHVVRSLKTGEEKSVTTGFTGGLEETWFPNGRSLLVNGRHGDAPRGFYRLDPASGASTLLKAGVFGASFGFSPGGQTLYYSQRLPNEDQTRVIAWDMESGKERELLRGEGQGPTHWIGLAVSPDGGQLATVRTEGKDRVLEVIPAAGGERREVHRVSEPEIIHDVQWSPDRHSLIFSLIKGDRDGLWRIPVEGGGAQDLGITARALGKYVIHPGGRHIAYVADMGISQVLALENFLPKAAK